MVKVDVAKYAIRCTTVKSDVVKINMQLGAHQLGQML